MKYNTLFVFLLIALAVGGCSGSRQGNNAPDQQQLFIGEDIAVASTAYGQVKGYVLRDIYHFMGIPYGANTSGKNRFMPPCPPEPWENVLPCVYYPTSAPQIIRYPRDSESYPAFVDRWNYDEIGEDCLRLNVWTPALDARKRPVIVWLHGGGFTSGNSIEQNGYNGENLARYGDVVFCSVNHRLNAFGFSDFSKAGDEAFKYSGNVGLLDIIAALHWVHNNIENFGGDPGNVTIIGQSGGGSKVSAIATMPLAKGLVHKAVALSGNSVKAGDPEYSAALGAFILHEAGLEASEMGVLQEMPWEDYLELANRAAAKFNQQIEGEGIRGGFGPVADGVVLPEGTYFSDTDPAVPDIPMIYCTTFHEWNPNRDRPELEGITLDQVVEQLKDRYGEDAHEIVAAYAGQFPDNKPIEILALISSNRANVVNAANTKLQQSAPVYMAWFGWEPPLFDGRMRAFHCIDICFWFCNTDLMVTHTGGGKTPRTLSRKMADALLQFMKTGDPNGGSLPEWPQYTRENGETMVLNVKSKVMNHPDGEARLVLEQATGM
ncbi:MAG TPA: carboxylesterase family protein [Bacteroidales bacterium]|nr:carboxylesterase family protein [Bacteroidales bacterium]